MKSRRPPIVPPPDGAITVAFMDPEAVMQLVDKPEVHALGKEVRALLQRVCTSLSGRFGL